MTAIGITEISTVLSALGRPAVAMLACVAVLLTPAAAHATPATRQEAPAGAAAHTQGIPAPPPLEPAGGQDSESIEEPLSAGQLQPGEAPLFSIDTPIGPLEYGLGRGLGIGRTGLHVGGFTTVTFDREDGQHGSLDLDSANLLVLLEPNEFVHGFMELEVGHIFHWETDQSRVHSEPDAKFERLYGDLRVGDPLTLRVGKFQTPVGRWNLVPEEPFVWTAIDPAFLEIAFDEHQTGVALLGSFHPRGGTLDYWVYGQTMPPLDPSTDPAHADHSVGGRMQYGRTLQQWSVGSSFLATEIGGNWSYLGGLDFEGRLGPVLLTSELTLQQGDIPDRDLWDVYLQGAFEIVPTLYLVARYERLDPSGSSQDSHIGDFGVAWIPKPYLVLKGTYRTASQQTNVVRRGLSLSFSFIF